MLRTGLMKARLLTKRIQWLAGGPFHNKSLLSMVEMGRLVDALLIVFRSELKPGWLEMVWSISDVAFKKGVCIFGTTANTKISLGFTYVCKGDDHSWLFLPFFPFSNLEFNSHPFPFSEHSFYLQKALGYSSAKIIIFLHFRISAKCILKR